ncbi:MAG: DUF924 domain-containing protein, partial [Fimbriimonadaceae bacterium]|nr:DUF924 domain-containing protein [Alphaproteobacteria bacterium]
MTVSTVASPEEIIRFWFDAGPKKWWIKDTDFDRKITGLFAATHAAAGAGKLDSWAENARGAMALTITLDQFSRNMFRNDPKSYAQDEKAR